MRFFEKLVVAYFFGPPCIVLLLDATFLCIALYSVGNRLYVSLLFVNVPSFDV